MEEDSGSRIGNWKNKFVKSVNDAKKKYIPSRRPQQTIIVDGKKLQSLSNKISYSDIRSDVFSAAMLSECRKEAHDLLKARYTSGGAGAYRNLVKCIEGFRKRNKILEKWVTLRTPQDEVYYFNIKENRAQWERPKLLSNLIEKGKRSQDFKKGEEWKECEFLHIQLFQAEQRTSLEGNAQDPTRCQREIRLLDKCYKSRTKNLKDDDF